MDVFCTEVKLVTCGILAKSVSSGCASALQAQHPHMVPLELELPRHFSSSGYNEGLPEKSDLTLNCNRVASPKMETRFLFCMNVIATFGNG